MSQVRTVIVPKHGLENLQKAIFEAVQSHFLHNDACNRLWSLKQAASLGWNSSLHIRWIRWNIDADASYRANLDFLFIASVTRDHIDALVAMNDVQKQINATASTYHPLNRRLDAKIL